MSKFEFKKPVNSFIRAVLYTVFPPLGFAILIFGITSVVLFDKLVSDKLVSMLSKGNLSQKSKEAYSYQLFMTFGMAYVFHLFWITIVAVGMQFVHVPQEPVYLSWIIDPDWSKYYVVAYGLIGPIVIYRMAKKMRG